MGHSGTLVSLPIWSFIHQAVYQCPIQLVMAGFEPEPKVLDATALATSPHPLPSILMLILSPKERKRFRIK